jgi:hypothetical protein
MENCCGGVSRRQMLTQSALGFGHIALTAMLCQQGSQVKANEPSASTQPNSGASPLAARPGHFAPRAKRVIFLFMKGGPSHIDTFDYKPELQKRDGEELPFDKPRVQFAPTGKLLKSPWKFAPAGQMGIQVSELFPNVAKHVDDLCFLHSVHGTNPAHGGALLKLHTGSDNFIRPSMGAWITYGLSTENDNLPAFITICPTLAHGGVKNWGSSFLPAHYQGTPIGNASLPSAEAKVRFLQNLHTTGAMQREQLDLLASMNQAHAADSPAASLLDARIASFELAFRMQQSMPEAMAIEDETPETHRLYGLDQPTTQNFGRQCLLARRFAERGVRFVQVTHSDAFVQWDQHSDLLAGHTKNAAEVDLPIAGLLQDLKQRGLLDDTLVIWGGEFGRTPTAQGTNGRDHNPEGFTMWLAGGGVKRGFRYGATDEFGYYAQEQKMHIHDFHATLLHLLGLDHERLTFRTAGRDFRLTDIAGRVAHDIFS